MKRLYNAVCGWLEADAQARAGGEPVAEGNNFTQAERAHGFTTMPEMHATVRGTELEDDNGEYRRVGFHRGGA